MRLPIKTVTFAIALLFASAPVFAATPTAISLALAPATNVSAGTVVTLSATVTGTSMSAGSVLFCDASAAHCEDAAVLGTATAVKVSPTQLSASIKLRFGVGNHNINAVFESTSSNLGSVSVAQTLTVDASAIYPSFTTITPTGSMGNYTFNGTVTGYGDQMLTGSVPLVDVTKGNVPLASPSLGLPFRGFATPVTVDSAGNVYAAAVGDFNGDGIPDIAYPRNGGNGISVALGNGDGTFHAPASYPVGITAYGVAVGDFNADGKLDLAVTNFNGNSISILLGNGDGTFQPQVSYPVGPNPTYISVGDFNGDGRLDLVTADFGGAANTVSVLLGNGDGTFQPQITYATGHSPYFVATGDFNGDGALDLVAVNNLDNTISVLLGNGDGTFQSQIPYAVGQDPSAVVVGDFNGDGNADLAITNCDDASVSILLGNGDGTFHAQVSYLVDATPTSVVIGDFNGDGFLDLVTSNWNSNSVSLLQGNGDGTFKTEISYLGARAESLSVGDFNGDGIPDLAISGSTLGVLLGNQTASFSATNVAVTGPGQQDILANYSGDASRLASQSGVAVFGSPVATTVSLSTSQNPAPKGGSVTLTAALTEIDGVNPTGLIAIRDGGVTIGTAPINGTSATYTTSSLSEGTHVLTAVYGGDADYVGATSTPISQVIAVATSSVLLSATPDPSSYGVPVTFTANVNPGATGIVIFKDGNIALGSASISGGSASISTSTLSVGTHTIKAFYEGDSNYSSSSSANLYQTVSKAPAKLTLTSSINPSMFGSVLTLTAATVPEATGTVTFIDGANNLGSVVLKSGVASLTISTLTAGSHLIVATYSGDSNYQ